MANLSNRNNSKNTTASNPTSTPAFKAGDNVLCPAIGDGIYTLQVSKTPNTAQLTIDDGRFIHELDYSGRFHFSDPLPSLFPDTPENRQAVKALWGTSVPSTLTLPSEDNKYSVLDYEDCLTQKSYEMEWLTSLFTVIRHISVNHSLPPEVVNDLVSIGSYLTDNFQYETDQKIKQLRAGKEGTQ